jgi:hypothetical protein
MEHILGAPSNPRLTRGVSIRQGRQRGTNFARSSAGDRPHRRRHRECVNVRADCDRAARLVVLPSSTRSFIHPRSGSCRSATQTKLSNVLKSADRDVLAVRAWQGTSSSNERGDQLGRQAGGNAKVAVKPLPMAKNGPHVTRDEVVDIVANRLVEMARVEPVRKETA